MRCSSAEWIARNRCALRWCHRGVGRKTEETVGFPEWTAQLCVWKTTGKDSSEACAIACKKCAAYSVFPSGTSHSKIAQFNWECIGRLTHASRTIQVRIDIPDKTGSEQKDGADVRTSDLLSTPERTSGFQKRRKISRASELLAVRQYGLCSM